MSRTVTLRIEDNLYEKLKDHAKSENRNLSNFIETAVINYIEQIESADEALFFKQKISKFGK